MIDSSELKGFAVGLNRDIWEATFKPAFHVALLPDVRKFNNEYLMAAYQFVHLISRRLMKRVDYTFHQRPKGQRGGWEQWYASLDEGALGPYIGTFAFKSSDEASALDAADFLAYFAYQRLLGKQPWQWAAIERRAPVEFFGLDQRDWESGAAHLQEDMSGSSSS